MAAVDEEAAEAAAATAQERIRIESRRFGSFEVAASDVFAFESGLIGFPGLRRFVLLDHAPGSPFRWMLSLEDPEVGFAVANPAELIAGYRPPIEDGCRAVEAAPEDLSLFAILTIPPNPLETTINLIAPVAVNLRSRCARQLVLDAAGLSARTPLVPAGSATEGSAGERA